MSKTIFDKTGDELLAMLFRDGAVSTDRGPTGDARCPKCDNSLQNARPDQSEDCVRRCATCKSIFLVLDKKATP